MKNVVKQDKYDSFNYSFITINNHFSKHFSTEKLSVVFDVDKNNSQVTYKVNRKEDIARVQDGVQANAIHDRYITIYANLKILTKNFPSFKGFLLKSQSCAPQTPAFFIF